MARATNLWMRYGLPTGKCNPLGKCGSLFSYFHSFLQDISLLLISRCKKAVSARFSFILFCSASKNGAKSPRKMGPLALFLRFEKKRI